MKKIILSVITMALVPAMLFAADAPQVATIKVSSDWGKAQCAAQPGKGITLGWKGVEDKRTMQSIGTLKKGDDETEVNLAMPVKDLFAQAIVMGLQNCGFEVKTKDDGAGGIATTIDVNEFFAGSKKGFFTGETDAKGSVTFHFNESGRSYDFNLGASKTDKRLRKKNVKQLETVMTGVLESLVVQMAESTEMYTELKKLAGK